MRAVVLNGTNGFDDLEVVKKNDPKPSNGEVLVRVRSASINYRDLLITKGGYGSRQKTSDLIPLSDAAGEVVEIGSGVKNFKVGDRVTGSFFQSWVSGQVTSDMLEDDLGRLNDGVLSELKCFKEVGLAATPDSLSDIEASAVPCAGLTAWSGIITLGKIKPGEVVLIQGSGGVSLFALQFAKMSGAKVLAISSNEKKIERLKKLGAFHCLNYLEKPHWGKDILKFTNGVGVDHIIEIGGGETIKQSLRAIKPGGTISLIGVLDGARSDLLIPLVGSRNIKLQGVTVGPVEELKKMLKALDENKVKPIIDSVYDLSNFLDAYNKLSSGQHFGKICIKL
tara:strand:+ start:1484 stop:2497 length:1014 start_codon:yes stop_codon:yes gene_type:complete